MKGFRALLVLLALAFLLFACACAPRTRFVEATISKGINKGTIAESVEPTSTFSTDDPEVIAHIKLENLSGKHNLKWEWYDPNGDLYYSTGNHTLRVTEGKYHKFATAWNKLFVRGEKAADLLGDWQVKLYLDNDLHASKNFRIDKVIGKDLPKIAVWDLNAGNINPSYAQDLTSILVSEISKLAKYEVYSRENIRTVAGWTEQKMILGCTDTKCLTALGQMDISKLISGRVGRIGRTYSISLQLFDTQKVRAENSISEECSSEDELTKLVRQAVPKLLRVPQ